MTGDTATVVLPTYNEAKTAPAVVGELLEFETVDEIVVVDDDSPDNTGEIIENRYDDAGSDVSVIIRTEESGLSSAVLRGFAAADTDVVACMDGDGQHPPGSVVNCIKAVHDGADLAAGSRHVETGSVADDWPVWRQTVSHGARLLAQVAIPDARSLTDPMTGLFAVRRDLVESVRGQLNPIGYKIMLEIVGRAPVSDVREVGYTFRKREHGASNLGPGEYVKYVAHLSRLVVPSRRPGDYYVAEPAEVES